MNSPHQREQLPDLLSDALTPAERARVESHLAACEQCARELRALQQMQQTLASLPAVTPPDSLRANVRAALREDKKQGWALSALQAKRTTGTALPFALPARQLAWGGAVAVGAVGLMLLARPSLQTQTDAVSMSAPVSEAELAAKANADAANVTDSTGAVKAPKTKAPDAKTPGKVKPNPPTVAPKNESGLPDSVASLPPLAAPPIAPSSDSVKSSPARIEQPEILAPLPTTKTPAFEPSADAAPATKPPAPKPAPAPKTAPQPPKQANTRASETKPIARPQPKSVEKPSLGRAVAPKPAPATPRANLQAEAPPAPVTSGTAGTQDAPADSEAADESTQNRERARADESADNAPAAFAPPSVVGRVAPAPAPAPAPARAMPQKSLASNDWAGGAVSAKIKRAGNRAPILTLGVALAVGNARLTLELPGGATQVWRGSMNAAPVEISLDKMVGRVRSGQKIRARLEQIDGEGNPKSSTNFDLTWP